MLFEYILKNNLLIFLLELAAAIAGRFYINRSANTKIIDRLFVYSLWLVVFVELVGFYPIYAYFNDYKTLPFIKNTPFQYNYWWYNSYGIVKFAIFFIYFLKVLEESILKKWLEILSAGFIFTAIINLSVSGVFFVKSSSFTAIGGTLVLVLLILLYFFQLLKSNRILYFYNNITFYISLALLIWYLTVTPLFIYNQYFGVENPVFLSLHIWVLRGANIYLYGFLIVGFLICSKKQSIVKG